MKQPIRDLEPILRDNLLKLARAYARARGGIALRTVSRYAHGDDPFFDRLARGEGSFTIRKYDEIRKWFSENRPRGMRWPKLHEPWAEDRREA